MLTATTTVKNAIKAPSREIKGKVSLYRGGTTTPISTFSYNDVLSSVQIERMGGNNKFFGFGVCQTAVIKVKDIDKQLDIQKADALQVSFGVRTPDNEIYWCDGAHPYFYVNDIQRDETSNTLTITAGDKLYDLALRTHVSDLNLVAPYTLLDFATKAAECMGLNLVIGDTESDNEFTINYENGANFDGTETLREALEALAEVTQTYYYIRLDTLYYYTSTDVEKSSELISKSQYFTLDVGEGQPLTAICATNSLGDSITAEDSVSGYNNTQYVRDNPFWDMLDGDILGERVNNAMYKMSHTDRTPFTISWRGNFLYEVGDWVGFEKKEGGAYYFMPITTSTITYDGGYREVMSWSYEAQEGETTNNPSTLGEVLKQTYARVNKANKEIEMLASESKANSSNIASLYLTTDEISGSVSNVKKSLDEASGEVEELKKAVSASITAEDVTLAISTEMAKGSSKVITETGFTFDDEGLTVSKSGSEMKTTITEDGMKVYRGNTAVLTANNSGVDAVNLHATTYLIIGKNSRIEDYGSNRTGCFWIGG